MSPESTWLQTSPNSDKSSIQTTSRQDIGKKRSSVASREMLDFVENYTQQESRCRHIFMRPSWAGTVRANSERPSGCCHELCTADPVTCRVQSNRSRSR